MDIGDLKFDLSKIKTPSMQMPSVQKIDTSGLDAVFKERKENHDNLERIATATEDINTKFDFVSKDLDYILNSLGANFQRLEGLEREEKDTLDQILLLLQYKGNEDSKTKIKSLLVDKGTDFVLNVILAFVQLKMTGV